MNHPPKNCVICDAEFRPWTAEQKCCSKSCGQKLRFDVHGRSRRDRACEICGQRYDATYTQQRTCSRQCGGILNNQEKPRTLAFRQQEISFKLRDCLECGHSFLAFGSARLCSDQCRENRADARRAARRIEPRPCKCGAPLAWPRRSCDTCMTEAKREERRRRKRRRRARERGAKSEQYTLIEIAARDQERCGLCHRKVDMRRAVPHPKAPTIDHVVPLADGGDDTKANVQLAHFLCNSIKSDGGSQQLALIG